VQEGRRCRGAEHDEDGQAARAASQGCLILQLTVIPFLVNHHPLFWYALQSAVVSVAG
jgi:hypothetical protein